MSFHLVVVVVGRKKVDEALFADHEVSNLECSGAFLWLHWYVAFPGISNNAKVMVVWVIW
jgi:hypothetical protein